MDFEGIKKSIDGERDMLKSKVGELEAQQKEIARQLAEFTSQLQKLEAAKAGLDGKVNAMPSAINAHRRVVRRTESGRIRRTDEQIVAILKDMVAKGYTVQQTATHAGVTPLSIYHWKRKHPELFKAKKK